MPRPSTFLQHVYIADGFADDCDELMHRCSKFDFLRFATFIDIWKDMQLSCIYQGRTSGAEVAELSEEVLHVAKHYMISNTDNFEESIAGLFLVYALLNLQPFPGFASLRIVQDDLPAINRIATVARRDRRHDVLYILGSVLIKNSEYHAAVRERGMEYPIRKYLEGHATVDRLGVRPKGVFFRQNEELDIIRELSGLELRYNAAKTAVTGTSNPDRNLNYTNSNLAKEMGDSLKNLASGIIEESDEDDEETQDTVQSIKQKAMKSKVEPVKHLVAVDSRSKSRKLETQEKSDIKTSPGKVKASSPTQPLATNSPAKRKAVPQRRPKPTPKRTKQTPRITFESDDSDDEDISLPSSDGSSDSEMNNSPILHEESTQESIQESTQEQEIDIEIDSLPCFIRSEEGGQLFEIEIIDELKTDAAKNKDVKVSELPGSDVTIKKIKKNKDKDSAAKDVVVDQNEMAEISKVGDVIAEKQTEVNNSDGKSNSEVIVPKKAKKNVILKSKLHKLGVLDVADLKMNEKEKK